MEYYLNTLLIILIPAFSALFCGVMSALRFPVWERVRGTDMRLILLAYFFAVAFNWVAGAIQLCYPRELLFLRQLTALCVLFVPILSYHFVYLITMPGRGRKFALYHYAPPVAMFVFYLVVDFSVSHVYVYGSEGARYNELGYMHALRWLLAARFIYGIVYTSLSIIRLAGYRRRIVDYSSDLARSSMSWLKAYIILFIAFIAIPLFSLATPVGSPVETVALLVTVALMTTQHIVLCFNVVRGNFVWMGMDDDAPSGEDDDAWAISRDMIRRDKFEQFIVARKPYLDPTLKITDLASAMGTNRSYLSGFINKTYKASYSQFINECRLRELDALLDGSAGSRHGTLELITAAGFGSYQSYRRAQKQRLESTLLPPDL